MVRHKDTHGSLPEGKPDSKGTCNYESNIVHSALLMDISDELKELNRRLRNLKKIVGFEPSRHGLVAQETGDMNDRDFRETVSALCRRFVERIS